MSVLEGWKYNSGFKEPCDYNTRVDVILVGDLCRPGGTYRFDTPVSRWNWSRSPNSKIKYWRLHDPTAYT